MKSNIGYVVRYKSKTDIKWLDYYLTVDMDDDGSIISHIFTPFLSGATMNWCKEMVELLAKDFPSCDESHHEAEIVPVEVSIEYSYKIAGSEDAAS